MKKQLYKVYFRATRTIHGGKEKRTLEAVYMPRVDTATRKHITEEQRIERGTQALAAEGFYNIEYGSTIATEIIFAE